MRSRWSAIISCVALLWSAAPTLARGQDLWKPDTQIGDFQFNMPNGWKRVDARDGPTLVPTNLPQGATAFIGFLQPQVLRTDLRSWFDATWAEWQKQFKVVDASGVTSGHHANGFDFYRIDARVSGWSFGYSIFTFAAAQVGNRVEAYYYVNNSGYSSYQNSLSDFETSLTFSGLRIAQSGRVSGGGDSAMSGLYVGYRMRDITPFEQMHLEYLVFFPDGNVIRFLPEHGLEHFDFAATLKTSRDYCGRYRVTGSRIAIQWGDNGRETATQVEQGLRIGKDSYLRTSSSDRMQLDGTYRREGADLGATYIRFTRDSSFVENGMLRLLAYSGADQSPGQGTYRIAQNTLTLRYRDGRTIALSFFILPMDEGGPRPASIRLNTYALVRNR